MLYVEEAALVKSAGEETYSIDPGALRECEDVMESIRASNPSFWPHGLSVDAHRRCNGNVFLIREASTHRAIGFTGWQEFKSAGRKIGYYSIGILPEYRGNGYAKKAVAALLHKKAATVDQVRAYIMPHNKPSIALAQSLGIPIDHEL